MAWRVLVVEDDFASGDILLQLLRYSQINVDVAADAAEALVYLGRNAYSLALIDLALPEISGWELLSDILSNPQTMTLPCVAITAYYDPSLARRAISAGFVACFPKPANLELVEQLKATMTDENSSQ